MRAAGCGLPTTAGALGKPRGRAHQVASDETEAAWGTAATRF